MISPELLRRFPVFAGFSDAELKQFAMIGEERELQAGEMLYEEGKPAGTLNVITEGVFSIRVSLEYDEEGQIVPGGREVDVTMQTVGDVNGWSSLVEPYTMTASIVADTDGKVASFSSEEMLALCEENPELGFRIMRRVLRIVNDYLRTMQLQLASVSA